jgi:hypothetical protein
MGCRKSAGVCVVLFILTLVIPPAVRGQTDQEVAPQQASFYPHSLAGIEQQFADILQIVRTGDEAAIHKALYTLSIPDASSWSAANFAAPDAAPELLAYQEALHKFQSHVWWVTGNFGKNPGFALKVESSEIPGQLSDVGFEGLVARPVNPVTVENFRFSPTPMDPKLGPPSWVSSFIHFDGRFRMIGGTYPFWAEGLNASRGPMSLPARIINGRLIQGEAFRNDSKRQGIDGIVHVKVEIKNKGKLKKMKIISGDPQFVKDAKQYLSEAEFSKLPKDPRLHKAKMIWDMEVVFFSPATSPPSNQ